MEREYPVVIFGKHPILVLEGEVVDGQMKVPCPFCQNISRRGKKAYHLHGVSDGERVAHCSEKMELEFPSGIIVSNKSYYIKRINEHESEDIASCLV